MNSDFNPFATWVLDQPSDSIAISVNDIENWWGARYHQHMGIDPMMSFSEYKIRYRAYYGKHFKSPDNIPGLTAMMTDYQSIFRDAGGSQLWRYSIECQMRQHPLDASTHEITFRTLKRAVIEQLQLLYKKDFIPCTVGCI